jgi:hypothetical protein
MPGPGVFKDSSLTDEYSYSGNMTNPSSDEVDGTAGGAVEEPIFLGNTDVATRLTNLHIECANGDANVYYLYAPDVAGAPGTYAVALDLADIVGVGFHKVWAKLVVPPGAPAKKRHNIRHRFSGMSVPV